MPLIPEAVAFSVMFELLKKAGLICLHRGKVRDTFLLSGHDDKLLVVASNRISVFDIVLGFLISGKGAVLTALTVFWLTGPLAKFRNHLVAFGAGIDEFLPEELRGNPYLQANAIVVQKHMVIPVEAIVRRYLTGSGWGQYEKTGMVCGIKLPAGIKKGDRLEQPIFTPTTKAEEGHDQPLLVADVVLEHGAWIRDRSIEVFLEGEAHETQCGFNLLDTKFEWTFDILRGRSILIDEVLTPDSSRKTDSKEHEAARKRGAQPSAFDKQYVRDLALAAETGCGVPFNKLDLSIAEHRAFAQGWHPGADVVAKTSELYHEVQRRLCKKPLLQFQQEDMGIAA